MEFTFLEVVGWNDTDMMDCDSNAVFKGQCRKYAEFEVKNIIWLFNQVPLIPSASVYIPQCRLFLCISTQFQSMFLFIRHCLSADHLQRLNALLTTSFNLNYWNRAQREKTVSLILEIQLLSLYDTGPKMAHTRKISSVK